MGFDAGFGANCCAVPGTPKGIEPPDGKLCGVEGPPCDGSVFEAGCWANPFPMLSPIEIHSTRTAHATTVKIVFVLLERIRPSTDGVSWNDILSPPKLNCANRVANIPCERWSFADAT